MTVSVLPPLNSTDHPETPRDGSPVVLMLCDGRIRAASSRGEDVWRFSPQEKDGAGWVRDCDVLGWWPRPGVAASSE